MSWFYLMTMNSITSSLCPHPSGIDHSDHYKSAGLASFRCPDKSPNEEINNSTYINTFHLQKSDSVKRGNSQHDSFLPGRIVFLSFLINCVCSFASLAKSSLPTAIVPGGNWGQELYRSPSLGPLRGRATSRLQIALSGGRRRDRRHHRVREGGSARSS